MASLNRVMLIGNLGRDPETRFFQDGTPVCNVSVACSESWKDKTTGERKEATEWVPVVFTGPLAKVAGEYLKKGSQIYVEGSLRTRKWTDKNGVEKYTTEVKATEMKMLGSRAEGSGGGSTSRPAQQQAPQQQNRQGAQPSQGGFDDFEDSIPF